MGASLRDEIRAAFSGRRLVILGVGNAMRGDDGFGPLLAARLAGRLACPVLDCGSVPENFTGKVRALSPEAVLVLDAAELGAPPGELRLVPGAEAGGLGVSTHAAGLEVFFRYVKEECGADGWLLAVQAGRVGLGEDVSAEVTAALDQVAALLAEVFPGDA